MRISGAIAISLVLGLFFAGCSGSGGSGPLSGDYYVRAGETGVGTLESPFGSVQDAIDAASDPATILVAAGTYAEDIVLKDGVSLFGGCNADFTDRLYRTEANRENSVYRTVLRSTKTSGGNPEDPVSSFLCSGTIAADTVVEGFTILNGTGSQVAAVSCVSGANPNFRFNTIAGIYEGTDTSYSYGVFIMSSSPTVENNVIIGWDSSGYGAIGIYCSSNSDAVTISGNEIYGGDGAMYGIGIQLESPGEVLIEENSIIGGYDCRGTATAIQGGAAGVTVTNNLISAGSTTVSASYGAYGINGSGGIVRNNLIHGGTGDSTHTFGIAVGVAAYSEIDNNTICGGSGSSFAVGISSTGHPYIRNNLIFTTAAGTGSSSYDGVGVMENGGDDTDPYALRNNNIFDCPEGLFVNQQGTTWTAVGYPDINDYTYTTQVSGHPSSGNLSEDLLDAGGTDYFEDFTGADGDASTLDDNDWRLASSAPLGVRGGAMDLSTDFTDDCAGTVRTTGTPTGAANDDACGWSMGALERD